MKHLLNDLSDEEKNNIRNQHTGGMKVMTESFSRLANSKLGDSKPLVTEEDEDEDQSLPFLKRIIAKLKGISEKKIKYNMEHDLPWDWEGSKEGYYEKMEPRKRHTGSN
jgi:hypothetical protein